MPGLCPGLLLRAALEPPRRRIAGAETRLRNPSAIDRSFADSVGEMFCFSRARKKAKVSGATGGFKAMPLLACCHSDHKECVDIFSCHYTKK